MKNILITSLLFISLISNSQDLLDKYVEYCYNDSVELCCMDGRTYSEVYEKYKGYIPNCMNLYELNIKFRRDKICKTNKCGVEFCYIYLHREPTIEGYVKWRKESINRLNKYNNFNYINPLINDTIHSIYNYNNQKLHYFLDSTYIPFMRHSPFILDLDSINLDSVIYNPLINPINY